MRLTFANLRHLLRLFRFGSRPAVTVYESIGADSPLAPAPGFLNLGLWEGDGTEEEAPQAVRRLVDELATALPSGGVILDVANGLGAQDLVIARRLDPRTLVAINLTEAQLREGRPWLAEAGARPVVGDAVRLPIRDRVADGVISVEAAFHFSSRARFFAEVARVLRPGGVVAISDISAEHPPRTIREGWAGLTLLRFWGISRHAAVPAARIKEIAEQAGLVDVRIEPVGGRVFDPILTLASRRLERVDMPAPVRWAGRYLLGRWRLLWERGLMEYVLVTARAPMEGSPAATR